MNVYDKFRFRFMAAIFVILGVVDAYAYLYLPEAERLSYSFVTLALIFVGYFLAFAANHFESANQKLKEQMRNA